MIDHVAAFLEFLRAQGIGAAVPSQIRADDKINRYQVDGDRKGSKNGSYRLAIEDDMAFGWARSHKFDKTFTFYSGKQQKLTPEERAELEKRLAARQEAAVKERKDIQGETALLARDLWAQGNAKATEHKYATRKKVDLAGIKIKKDTGEILVPLYDIKGQLWNIQKISPNGSKMFLKGGRILGCYHPIGKRPSMVPKPFIFCEGWATGKTLWEILKCPVVCTMNTANILPVARAFRRKYPYARFVFAADNDQWVINPADHKIILKNDPEFDPKKIPGSDPFWQTMAWSSKLVNPGREKSAAVAKAVNGYMLAPEIPSNDPYKKTDYNDLYTSTGEEPIRLQFAAYLKF